MTPTESRNSPGTLCLPAPLTSLGSGGPTTVPAPHLHCSHHTNHPPHTRHRRRRHHWDYHCAADITLPAACQPSQSFSVADCQAVAHCNRSAQRFSSVPILSCYFLFLSSNLFPPLVSVTHILTVSVQPVIHCESFSLDDWMEMNFWHLFPTAPALSSLSFDLGRPITLTLIPLVAPALRRRRQRRF